MVEDEYLIASDLSAGLRKAGAQVLGPARDTQAARRMLATDMPDAAVLDIQLMAEVVYPLADELARAGVPFVFTTGYDRLVLPPRFRRTPCHEKPVLLASLVEALAASIDAQHAAAALSAEGVRKG